MTLYERLAKPAEAVASADMTLVPIRCGACGRYFETKKARRIHIDKEHRITDADIRVIERTDTDNDRGSGSRR